MLRAPADDDRIAFFSGVLNDLFGKLQDAFAIDEIELVRIQAAFVASAQKRFEEAVVEGIGAFFANFDDGFRAIREPGDLFGEQLIPKLPAELCRKQLSDFASAASVLSFDGDDLDHALSPRRL